MPLYIYIIIYHISLIYSCQNIKNGFTNLLKINLLKNLDILILKICEG